ncbi:MAG: sigma 54-interacting transcriptional regulator [Deltaproteobacteria bacterium]|nr:sigma 54-interacting transcriptional regulator [Deltaproteobacteria bacterium]
MSRPPHLNETLDTPAARATSDKRRRLVHAPSSPLCTVLASLDRVAKSRAPVLVTGESGTGKEGIVRMIHDLAPWASGPFVPVNCGAIPTTLLESELFGHVRGAFTGADRNRVGRFEAASGGTLFLDEIGETPLELQVKLLRVLQDRVFVPVGGSTPKSADVRVIAATNIDVTHAVREGRFREDLFFRLDVIRIELPPLRARPMDIEPLARHFIAVHAGPNQSKVDDVTPEALAELRRHTWPGNVRELENVIQGILVLKEAGAIEASDIRHKLGLRGRDTSRALELRGPAASHFDLGPIEGDEGPTTGPSVRVQVAANPASTTLDSLRLALPAEGLALKDTLERLERELITEALTRAKGNRARAASLLGLNRTTLVEKLRRMPIGKVEDLEERVGMNPLNPLNPIGELRAEHLEH